MVKYYSTISFCTAVKNRLQHLQLTLPQNLIDNKDYPHLQFVILDYNSSDRLEDWVKEEMIEYIQEERLIYFKTPAPGCFHRSHSRNLAMLLGKSEIICNIDADNFTGKNFANYINDVFNNNKNVFLSSIHENVKTDVLGRLCCKKDDFIKAGGYDELIEEYGFEDQDLVNRLAHIGLNKIVINDPFFLNAVSHNNTIRLSEEKSFFLLYKVYTRHISHCKSEILILFKNGAFNSGTLIDCTALYSAHLKYACGFKKPEFDFTLAESEWQSGTWTGLDKRVNLGNLNEEATTYNQDASGNLKNKWKKYQVIDNADTINDILLFRAQFINRSRMQSNLANENIQQDNLHNIDDLVYKNFDYNLPIRVKL